MAKKYKEILKHCIACGGMLEPNKNNNDALTCSSCGYKAHYSPFISATLIIEDDNEGVLIAKRGIEPAKDTWDLPGGFIQVDEKIEEAAAREAKEELGVDIRIIELIGSNTSKDYIYNNVVLPIVSVLIRAKVTHGEPKPSDDISECKFIAKKELKNIEFGLSEAKEAVDMYLKQRSLAVIE